MLPPLLAAEGPFLSFQPPMPMPTAASLLGSTAIFILCLSIIPNFCSFLFCFFLFSFG